MDKIAITRTTAPKEKVPSDKLGFGKVFSDHMFLMNLTQARAGTTRGSSPTAPSS